MVAAAVALLILMRVPSRVTTPQASETLLLKIIQEQLRGFYLTKVYLVVYLVPTHHQIAGKVSL